MVLYSFNYQQNTFLDIADFLFDKSCSHTDPVVTLKTIFKWASRSMHNYTHIMYASCTPRNLAKEYVLASQRNCASVKVTEFT